MQKPAFLLFIVLFVTVAVHSQKIISLSPEPIVVAEKYHFRNVAIMDSRLDTTMLGRVVRGTFGISESLAPLKLNKPNLVSFQEFYDGCTKEITKGEQDILIHITDIFLDEDAETGVFGTVDVRAEVYAVKDGMYYAINVFDQNEVVTAFDATKKMIRQLNTCLKNVLEYANNFHKPTVFDVKGLTLEEVVLQKYEERKKKFAVYATENLHDGIYGTYEEFMDNKPGRPINMLDEVIATNMAKKKKKRESLYGYCKEGVIYMFNDMKYDTTRIYRKGKDFYMQNYGVDHDKQQQQNTLSWFTGLAILMDTDSWYEYVLNPRNGTWYQMTKLGKRKRANEAPQEPAATSSD
jgi:hypothetical protein